MRTALFPALMALALSACAATAPEQPPQRAAAAAAPLPLPPMKRFGAYHPQVPQRANADIARDFLDLSFRLESGRDLPWMTRFEGPVSVTLTGPIPPTAPHDLDALLVRFRTEAHIPIHRVNGPANITVQFLPRAEMQALVPQAACFVAPRVQSWDEFRRKRATRTVDWASLRERQTMAVFIPSDTSPQEVRDCLHEEIAQGLGPLDDLYRLADSVFDDDNFHDVLTGFDMLILRVYYSPELHSGTTRAEAAALLPGILARLNPAGQHITPGRDPGPTPRAWINAIETALGPRASDGQRRAAAGRALRIAQGEGWDDARMAFSYFVFGRLGREDDPEQSLEALRAAQSIYRNLPDSSVQQAHVNMQLAAYALAGGAPDTALKLIDAARPVAMQSENAALLATLLLMRADALSMKGDKAGAKAARVDSIGWARYGFGTERRIQQRIARIAALGDGTDTGPGTGG